LKKGGGRSGLENFEASELQDFRAGSLEDLGASGLQSFDALELQYILESICLLLYGQ